MAQAVKGDLAALMLHLEGELPALQQLALLVDILVTQLSAAERLIERVPAALQIGV